MVCECGREVGITTVYRFVVAVLGQRNNYLMSCQSIKIMGK